MRSRPDVTESTPQRWQLLAPRLQQVQKLWSDGDNHSTLRRNEPRGYLFHADRTWDAWSKLARPVDTNGLRSNKPTNSDPRQTRVQFFQISRLESLPTEVISMIMADDGLSMQDLLALGLCSFSLWNALLKPIKAMVRASAAAWADTEIVCTGTYLQELPPTLEVEELKTVVEVMPTFNNQRMPYARGWNFTATRDFRKWEHELNAWLAALDQAGSKFSFNSNVLSTLRGELASLDPDIFPMGRWTLKNLTTKEYVRLTRRFKEENATVEVVAEQEDEGQLIRLDDVLLSQICWTRSHLNTPKKHLGRPGTDSWAGHRFEIVSMDDYAALETEGWTDATEAACRWTASLKLDAPKPRKRRRRYQY